MSKFYSMVPRGKADNLVWRKEVLRLGGESLSGAYGLWKMCSEDILFYINTFCWTYDPRPGKGKIPFITYEFQDDAILTIKDCIEVGKDFVMPKSRDMGASWIGLTVFEWFWHFREDQSFLLVSRNEDYVDKRGNPKSLFWKIDFIHEHEPEWLLPSGRSLGWKDPNRRVLHLRNGENNSIIDGESTTGDAGRGDRRTAMFIDEHAAFDVNDGFRVLRATRDTTKCRGFNSTPQGSQNGFYEVVHKTSAVQIRLHWSRHPEKSRGLYRCSGSGKVEFLDDFVGEVEVSERSGGGKVLYPDNYPFRSDNKLRSPWYDFECDRCSNSKEVAQELDIDFLGSSFQFFDPEFIEEYRVKNCREPLYVGDFHFNPDSLGGGSFRECPGGILSLWVPLYGGDRPPLNRHYICGVDISAGTGASNSVASFVDRDTGEKVAVLRTSRKRPNPFASLVIALCRWFGSPTLIWDASGPTGKVFTQRVIEYGYSDIYYRRNEKTVTRQISNEPGYFLNAGAREPLLEDYRESLSRGWFINRSNYGISECLQFVRKPDGMGVEHISSMNAQDPGGAKSAHGDEVIADALANLLLQERRVEKEPQEPIVTEGSLAYRRRQRSLVDSANKHEELGDGW